MSGWAYSVNLVGVCGNGKRCMQSKDGSAQAIVLNISNRLNKGG